MTTQELWLRGPENVWIVTREVDLCYSPDEDLWSFLHFPDHTVSVDSYRSFREARAAWDKGKVRFAPEETRQ